MNLQIEYSLYQHNVTSHITLTLISEKIQKLPKISYLCRCNHVPMIDCELCYHCFTLPHECVTDGHDDENRKR